MQSPEDNDPILDQDVSDVETAETPVEKSARELAIESIVEGNLLRREAETEAKLIDDAGQTPLSNQEQMSAQLSDDVIKDTAGKRIRVKVDGVERDVPLTDVLRDYQVGTAADNRLREATRLLNEAKTQGQAATAQVLDQAPAPVSVRTPEAVESQVKEAFEKLYEGDTDAAVSTFSRLIEEAKGAQATLNAISIDAIHEQLQERLAVDTAFATIQTDYPDVIADPDLELLTTIKRNQMMAAGRTQADAMLEASREVYRSLGKAVAAPKRQGESQGESRNEKLLRKARMDHIQAANLSAAQSDDDAQRGDVSSIIQEIANRRMGQSSAFTGLR